MAQPASKGVFGKILRSEWVNKMNYVALTQRIKICLKFPCIPICGHNLKKRKYIKTNITIKIDLFIHGGGEENGAVARGGGVLSFKSDGGARRIF